MTQELDISVILITMEVLYYWSIVINMQQHGSNLGMCQACGTSNWVFKQALLSQNIKLCFDSNAGRSELKFDNLLIGLEVDPYLPTKDHDHECCTLSLFDHRFVDGIFHILDPLTNFIQHHIRESFEELKLLDPALEFQCVIHPTVNRSDLDNITNILLLLLLLLIVNIFIEFLKVRIKVHLVFQCVGIINLL